MEQFKGALPIWLSPIQVNIVPINVKYHDEYCLQLKNRLLDEGIRVNYDNSEERMAKKVRESNMMKNPITVIIGDNERDNNLVSFSKLSNNEKSTMRIDEFIEFIKFEIKKR